MEGVEETSVHAASASSEDVEMEFARKGTMRRGTVNCVPDGKDCGEIDAVAREGDGNAVRSQGSKNAVGDS